MELEFDHASGPNPVDDDNIVKGSSPIEGQGSRSYSPNLVAPAGVVPVGAIAAGAIRVMPVDGVVHLPAGTRLDAIRLSGSHLIVTLPDGQTMVIVDGALHVPQIVLGRIYISPANIAALIAGQEPEPAAGAPQSSGGNFIETPGTIGDPFALGDLLPQSEFGVARPEDRSFLANVVDNKPEVLIFTNDQPLGSMSATATVSEAALPARGAETAGSNPSSNAETVTGIIQFKAIDLPYEITVNGKAITEVGQTVATPFGVITITSITTGEIGYSYTLVDNGEDPVTTDTITITVRDGDSDLATATLTLSVTDDVPTAKADTDDVAANNYKAQTGNVITGAGTTSGTAGADVPGADGAVVTGVQAASGTSFSTAGVFIAGQHGHLLIQPNGNYTYVRKAGSPGGVADVFTYRLTDGNGDVSTATLTFNIGDSAVTLAVPAAGEEGTLVDEAGLPERGAEPPGSRHDDGSTLTVGSIYFDAPDGPAVITINGVVVTGEGQEIEMGAGTFFIMSLGKDSLEYLFVLTDNVIGVAVSQPVDVTITDQDGDTVSSSFAIDILGDAPIAVNDRDTEKVGSADGNVLTGVGGTDANTTDGVADTLGADGATVTGVSFDGDEGVVGAATAGAYGTLTIAADGSYLYTLDKSNPTVTALSSGQTLTELFSYTISDGDGDKSTATLSVIIRGQNDGVTISGLNGASPEVTVLEASLPDGSAPDADELVKTGSFTFEAADGIARITIGGQALFDGSIVTGFSISTDYGTLTITAFDPATDAAGDIVGGTISYRYELTGNTALHTGVDSTALTQTFAISITDADGTVANSVLEVVIIDDATVAVDDNGDVGEGQTPTTDAATGLLGNDTPGADAVFIQGVRAQGNDLSGPASGGVGSVIDGLYGQLTVAGDGSYSYISKANVIPQAGATDVFVYTLRDGDGDTSTTTLTIYLTDSGLSATSVGLQVKEAGLAGGSDPESLDGTVSGDLSASVSGGTGLLGYALSGTGVGNYGTFALNPDGTYLYTLNSAVNGLSANNGADLVLKAEAFTYRVTDAFGNTSQNIIIIDVVDDVPIARPAPAVIMAENEPAISGDLFANDTEGADGATITSVNIDGVTVAVLATGTTSHTNAIGTYTFEASGAWTFDPVSVASATPIDAGFNYTITDGDGDQSSAQQSLTVTDGTNPIAGKPITLIVDDQHLDTGSAPSFSQPVSAIGEIHFTPGSDDITSIIFGDLSGLDGKLIWTRESDTQIIGWYTDVPVITLDLQVSGSTATIKATLDFSYSLHTDVTADDIAKLGSIGVVALDTDGDQAVGTVKISISDDVPTIKTIASAQDMLVVDESNLAVNATANFASLFDIVMGADRYGSVSYVFDVTKASGLIDVATGAKIVLHAMGNVVEGRLATSPSSVAFRLSIATDGQAKLDQLRAVQHANQSNPNDTVSLSSTLIRLFATVTDGDGDQATAFVLVGDALVFRDDGPSIRISAIDTNSILLTTQDGDTRNAAFDIATADLSSNFTAATSFGADGAGNAGQVSWGYALALGSAATSTGLLSNGVPITLALVAGTVVGSAGGSPIFSVAVDASTGVVTLTQFAEIDHPQPGSGTDYATQILELSANLIELRGTATIVDRDGDSVSDMIAVDLGGNIRFSDDGPSLSATGGAAVLVVDETNFHVNATANLSSLFQPTLDFGADGEGSVAYALGVKAGPSGLLDSRTGGTITLSIANGVVYGSTSSHEVFRISVGPGGNVTFDQSRAIMHGPDAGPDQIQYLLGNSLITLTATATDGDGDTASSIADITGYFGFRDDAPSPDNDEDNVARDGQTFADGNVLTGLGGTDDNGADGSPDNAGADGGLLVSGVSFAATAGTLGLALAGEYGFLTLAADGSYRYNLDPADPAVAALTVDQTLSDIFTYTVMDADGDVATATITIFITGANDFPIARADTNWVLDGPGDSDPVAAGNVLQDVVHAGAPSGNFADVADNDPNLEPISVTTAGTYVGLYGILVIAANGAYTYTLNEDSAAVNALDAGQTLLDNFVYAISDGLLSVESTLSVTVFGTNDAPTFGTSIARISEEGLAGGIADTAPSATLDTTNSSYFSGTLNIADPDAGQTLTATLGNPGAVLTAGGVPVIWTGVGTGTLIGSAGTSEVIRVTLASSGAYTVTLSKAVDHANATIEDLSEFSIPVSVFDGTATTTNATAIRIVIEDDAPTAVGEAGSSTQPQQDVNTLFILDFSDSIDGTELDVMLSAVKSALTQLDVAASGDLGIGFVIFSSGSFASPSFTTAAAANLYLDSLNPATGGERPSQAAAPEGIGTNTNYSGAIQTALANFAPVSGASNQVFFLSDGNPNQQVQFGGFPPRVVNSLTPSTATAWNNFVDNNGINVTAIGIDNNPLQPLNIQRLQDVDLNDAPNNRPILVQDFESLVSTLLGVIVPSAVSGDIDLNDAYGADGGRIFSIMVGSTTYTWDGASNIAVSTGANITGTSLTAIATPMGAALTFNFATGQYYYQPPTPITVTATEVFSYTLIDKDGDTATASLSITITAVAPPVVLDLDGDGVEFVSSAAGAAFATDFANEPQRAIAAATNGISTALIAAGLVAAAPLATHIQQALPSHDDTGPETPSASASQMVEQGNVERAAGWDQASDEIDDVLELRAEDIATGPQYFNNHDSRSGEQIDETGAALSAPKFSALLEPTPDEHRGPVAEPINPAIIMPPGSELTADDIKAVVTNAIEGRTVDLDALLGTNASSEHVLPQIQLHGEGGAGFAFGGDMPALGNLFMPDMAEQHIMAQMEQAAMTGHA